MFATPARSDTLANPFGATATIALLLAVGITLFPRASSAQDVVVRISYVEIHDRYLPRPELTSTSVQSEVRLNSDGSIQQNEARVSGSASGSQTDAMRLGADAGKRWKVAGEHQLLNIVDYITYSRSILVTVNGASCTAAIDYKLKPGATVYQYRRLKNNEIASARSVKATDLKCTIQ
jgi:hypothetical protein